MAATGPLVGYKELDLHLSVNPVRIVADSNASLTVRVLRVVLTPHGANVVSLVQRQSSSTIWVSGVKLFL